MKQDRYYFTKNFNLEDLTKKLLGYFEKELVEFDRCRSWFAISSVKKTQMLVVMVKSKTDSMYKYALLNLSTLEKSVVEKLSKDIIRLELPVMGRPLITEGAYSFCKLQGWSLEIGLIEQEEPCQTAEEAKKFIEAYAFCEVIYSSINQFAWGEKCLPQKGMLDGEEIFYVEINGMLLVVENKCHELYPYQNLVR